MPISILLTFTTFPISYIYIFYKFRRPITFLKFQYTTSDTPLLPSSLNATIQETLRIHSTSSLGLPRLVPAGGVTILDQYFPPGTVLSVPSYTMHHSDRIWNPNSDPSFSPEVFNPERWLPSSQLLPPLHRPSNQDSHHRGRLDDNDNDNENDGVGIGSGLTPLQKQSYIPFSTGPRACVGRNVADMELKMICATVGLGFDFVLTPEQKLRGLETREGFLRKPVRCEVGMRRRVRGKGGRGVNE